MPTLQEITETTKESDFQRLSSSSDFVFEFFNKFGIECWWNQKRFTNQSDSDKFAVIYRMKLIFLYYEEYEKCHWIKEKTREFFYSGKKFDIDKNFEKEVKEKILGE